MSYSKSELLELEALVDRALKKQFGEINKSLSASVVSYIDRGYGRRKMKKRFSEIMSETDADRLARRLEVVQNDVDDYVLSKKSSNRDRDMQVKDISNRDKSNRDTSNKEICDKNNSSNDAPYIGKSSTDIPQKDNSSSYKRKETSEIEDGREYKKHRNENVHNVCTPSVAMPKSLNSDKIKEMMLKAQKMIELRKQEMNIATSTTSENEATDKAQKASELKLNIQKQLANAGLVIKPKPEDESGLKSVLPMPLILDDQGRTIDSTGQEVELKAYQPTLKANIRAMKRDQYKAATERQVEQITDSQYFDERVQMKFSGRAKRNFKFHTHGKFQQLANRLRTKAQLERLQNEIANVAKKTGIASATRLAVSLPKKDDYDDDVPDIEWWDSVIVDPDTYNDGITYDKTNILGITNLIEHPIQLRPPTEPAVPKQIPVMLTKQERKKMRRQKRSESQQEVQEKIRLGLIPAPEAKVRVANLMRVLGTEAVQDPTKVEAHVRAQMAKRIAEHDKTNQDRKLTKEEKSQKRSKKLMEDTSLGVCVTIFRVRDLTSASIKFKVETNSKQLHMTGIVILYRDCNLVIVEGGPKQQIKFKRLMMKRIKWEDKHLLKEEGGLGEDKGPNKCFIVWEGSVQQRSFGEMKFKTCPTESICRETLRKNSVAHYWDLAYRATINNDKTLAGYESDE